MDNAKLKVIIESVLLAAGKPLAVDQLLNVFDDDEKPSRELIQAVIGALQDDYAERGIELVEVAGGFRVQVGRAMAPWVSRLIDEKPARYSRALLETLALVAYRQPITRGEIEDIRGVAVSSSIMKTLIEREWVRVIGHRDVPGRPAMYSTTKQFLDYFNLCGLDDLPSLMELRDIDTINAELELAFPGEAGTMVSADDAGAETDQEPAASSVQVPVDAADSTDTLH